MQFSEQIIQIIDKLCDKFGIALDWGNANVLPYIQELSNRLIKYEIFSSLLWIIFSILSIVISFIWFKNCKKNVKVNDDYYEFMVSLSIMIFLISLVVGTLTIVSQSFDIIQCLTIPEKTIIEFLSQYLK